MDLHVRYIPDTNHTRSITARCTRVTSSRYYGEQLKTKHWRNSSRTVTKTRYSHFGHMLFERRLGNLLDDELVGSGLFFGLVGSGDGGLRGLSSSGLLCGLRHMFGRYLGDILTRFLSLQTHTHIQKLRRQTTLLCWRISGPRKFSGRLRAQARPLPVVSQAAKTDAKTTQRLTQMIKMFTVEPKSCGSITCKRGIIRYRHTFTAVVTCSINGSSMKI